DYLSHAPEMSRPLRSFEDGFQVSEVERRRLLHTFGIYLAHLRHKDYMTTRTCKQCEVGVGSDRVLAEIFGVIELGRVHKNAAYRVGAVGYRLCHQRAMTCMQSSHGRHKTYLYSFR